MRHAVVGAIYLILSGLFGWIFYVRYWSWRECIEQAMSSCITPDGANLIGGGRFWIVPAILFAVAFVRRVLRWRKAHSRSTAINAP